jgi:hypothetical protein
MDRGGIVKGKDEHNLYDYECKAMHMNEGLQTEVGEGLM